MNAALRGYSRMSKGWGRRALWGSPSSRKSSKWKTFNAQHSTLNVEGAAISEGGGQIAEYSRPALRGAPPHPPCGHVDSHTPVCSAPADFRRCQTPFAVSQTAQVSTKWAKGRREKMENGKSR